MSADPPVFPDGFFARADESADPGFYRMDRLVTHIDEAAIVAVGELYAELGLGDSVLDLCSSWISHIDPAPTHLVALGLNAGELAANPAATECIVHDLNIEPALPFADARFDAVTCCVSVDYLTRPLAVFAEVARVLRPGGVFVCTYSNRCFPTKAIRGWLSTDDLGRGAIITRYFEATAGFAPAEFERRDRDLGGDPLYGVWARCR